MAQEGIAQRYRKEVATEFQEQTKEGKEILIDIAKSHAFIYPLQGIYYSLRHPSLFASIKSQIYKSALTSLVITVLFFTLFYLPQVAFLAFTSGPLAFIAAIPVVLGEAALTSKFITKGLWLGDAHEKLFDTVLASQPSGAPLVENAKNLSKSSAGRSSKVGKLLLKPVQRFSPAELVRYAISLPLSVVPGLGTAFFLVYNGTKSGPNCHNRYFALKGQSGAERDAIVAQRRGAYASFGVMATALQLIPVVSMVFDCTSTVGAALWAAELERLGERANDPQQKDVLPEGGEPGACNGEPGEGLEESRKEL
ncbi:hypothetical protein HWV62_44915 [Athelia sp. TMB]|nr:hypothetical protein HWV62_44915 [Athelia sp. TMB]